MSPRAVEAGFDVVGFDVDEGGSPLAGGQSFIDDVTDDDLRGALATGRFRPSSDAGRLAGFDVAVISVPTPLRDGAPDLRYIESAAAAARAARAARLLRDPRVDDVSRARPRSCSSRCSRTGPGSRAGADFRVGYSPERIDPGNPTWNFRNTPKIVSGIDAASLDGGRGVLSTARRHAPCRVAGVTEAELAKLLENTFRHVNIALVNELAMFAHELGIDVWEVDRRRRHQAVRVHAVHARARASAGTACRSTRRYLSWQVRRPLGQVVPLRRAGQRRQRAHARLRGRAGSPRTLNAERKARQRRGILLLGLAYKKNTGDARESPAVAVVEPPRSRSAPTSAPPTRIVEPATCPTGVHARRADAGELAAADVVVVLTDHDAFDWVAVAEVADKVSTRATASRAPAPRSCNSATFASTGPPGPTFRDVAAWNGVGSRLIPEISSGSMMPSPLMSSPAR